MRDAVRAMQERLRIDHGVDGRLLKRPVANEDRETWMEIYDGVDAAFEAATSAAFESALERSGIARTAIGTRHVERFVDID